jgi:hypothetical protein
VQCAYVEPTCNARRLNIESGTHRLLLKGLRDNSVAGLEGSLRSVRAVCGPFFLGVCNVRV